ncbi:MAG: hypothetical protein QM755_23875 [Luteolibacter sp.]
MNQHFQTVQAYSDTALRGVVKDLSRTGQWPDRLRAASEELRRRETKRHGKAGA